MSEPVRLDFTSPVLGQRVTVSRRDSDGMTWLRIENETGQAICVALDAEEAWRVALAMLAANPAGGDR